MELRVGREQEDWSLQDKNDRGETCTQRGPQGSAEVAREYSAEQGYLETTKGSQGKHHIKEWSQQYLGHIHNTGNNSYSTNKIGKPQDPRENVQRLQTTLPQQWENS